MATTKLLRLLAFVALLLFVFGVMVLFLFWVAPNFISVPLMMIAFLLGVFAQEVARIETLYTDTDTYVERAFLLTFLSVFVLVWLLDLALGSTWIVLELPMGWLLALVALFAGWVFNQRAWHVGVQMNV